jgi:hypothetical protein
VGELRAQEVPKANDFAKGESTAHQKLTIGGDGD